MQDEQEKPPQISPWTKETVGKLKTIEEIQEQEREEAGEPPILEEVDKAKRWTLVESILQDFESENKLLLEHMEEQAAMIYENQGKADSEAQMRGYYFELLSRYTPLEHPLVISHEPSELRYDREGKAKLEARLGEISQKTVFELKAERPKGEKIAWDKGAIIATVIEAQLAEEMSEEERQSIAVYVPARDENFKHYRELLNSGKVVVRFDPQTREWATFASEKPKAEAQQAWANRANEINRELNQTLTLPDAVLFEDNKAIGVIESKCWEEEEITALLEYLVVTKTDVLGKSFTTEHINKLRSFLGKGKSTHGNDVASMNLILKLAEEVAFVQESTGQQIEEPLIVLRLPADIPPDEIEDLQDQLLARNFKNVLVQQMLLTTVEVEAIATEYIHSPKFIEDLEKRYQDMRSGRMGKVPDVKLKRNIKARMLALKMTSEALKEYSKPKDPTDEDHAKSRLQEAYRHHFK